MPSLSQIDELTIGDHSRLAPGDLCYFLREYTSGQNYSYSETNSLILNFKKSVLLIDSPSYRYKVQAINKLAGELREALGGSFGGITLVPIPPSRAKVDPEYDDRLIRLLHEMTQHITVDYRELIVQTETTRSSHASGVTRLTVPELIDVYTIDESLVQNIKDTIVTIDDVLTAGTHFKAAQYILSQRFPTHQIIGVFLARTVRLNDFELI